MSKILRIIFYSILFLSNIAVAETAATLPMTSEKYLGGRALYQKLVKNKTLAAEERGSFVELPLDHNNQQSAKFDLFYRLSPKFDRRKPSILFFAGGPGQSIQGFHLEKYLKKFNVIYFNARGVSFSRPRTYAQLLDAKNFSTEQIIRDAEALRKYLKIDQVTPYGVSYGTAAATMYAHAFPSSTKAVVLEGVVHRGDADLWLGPYRTKILQTFFDSLSSADREKITALSQDPLIPSFWFSKLGLIYMEHRDFKEKFKGQLDEILAMSQEEAIAQLNEFFVKSKQITESSFSGNIAYYQIGCQELSFGVEPRRKTEEFINGRLQNLETNFREVCTQIPGWQNDPSKTYLAERFLIQKPVSYFQGTLDGSTPAPQAMRHFKTVPQAQAQLIYIVNDGHTPVMDCLMNQCSAYDTETAVRFFEMAAAGQNISNEQLKKLDTDYRWVKASKLRSTIPGK